MSCATAVGPWPGDDIRLALRLVRDHLAIHEADGPTGLPYLPQLPARGPGADPVGRTAALLVELPVDLQPSGWRVVDRPGRDVHRAQAMLGRDLDDLAEAFDGYEGPLKLQVTGPWTLASRVRTQRGERCVGDAGLCRDLAQSLAEGLRRHCQDVRRLLPGAELVVQLDEPALAAVLAGSLSTSSGYGRHRSVDLEEARRGLGTVIAGARDGAARTVAAWCPGAQPALPLLREAGVDAVGLEIALLRAHGWESIAAGIEDGTRLWAALALGDFGDLGDLGEPGGRAATRTSATVQPLVRAWSDVGLPLADLAHVTLLPAEPLTEHSPTAAADALARVVDAARGLSQIAAD